MDGFCFAEFGLELEDRVLKECEYLLNYSKFLYLDGRDDEAVIIFDVVERLQREAKIFSKKVEKVLSERNTDDDNE